VSKRRAIAASPEIGGALFQRGKRAGLTTKGWRSHFNTSKGKKSNFCCGEKGVSSGHQRENTIRRT